MLGKQNRCLEDTYMVDFIVNLFAEIADFLNPSPNQWLSLIILLTVRVKKQIKIVKCSMKGGIL